MKKKLIWILIDSPNQSLVAKLREAIENLKLEEYNFIVTPSSIRPISIHLLKKYLETLLQQVKELEEIKYEYKT